MSELPAATPTQPAERIAAIDVLRGFALLGILLMNIQSFAMIGMAYLNPYTYGDMTGANYLVWWACHVFADQKFMTIFSALFGAGIVLFADRREADSGRPARIHYRRMAVLLVIGLIHAYAIWFGDILVTYALCGMVVYPLRRLRPRTLIVLGLALISVHSLINLGLAASWPRWPAEARAGFLRDFTPTPEKVAQEVAAMRGSWLEQMPVRARGAVMFQTVMLATWSFWRVTGLMLIGMALFRLGVFGAKLDRRIYAGMVVFGLAAGIPLILAGQRAVAAHEWDPAYLLFTGGGYNYWGSLFVSLAYVGLIMLACGSGRLAWLTAPLAAVGRLALTNYLMQSLIATLIFNGHGLGLFGSIDRVGQVGIVLTIWAFQLVTSSWYVRRFRFGPAEWLWRTCTYGRRPDLTLRASDPFRGRRDSTRRPRRIARR